jgi:nudix-type nucleoside diphosphatase (YffH/AdpP family)
MRVDILDTHEDYNYRNFFTMLRAKLRYERFDGRMSDVVERLCFERGNAVGVVLYDDAEDVVLLTEQFRYPAYVRDGSGWIVEIVAGAQDKGRDVLTVAHSEVVEELGYRLDHLERICDFYLSPGGTSEKMALYLGYVRHAERVNAGGGLASEHEDLRMVKLPLAQALHMITTGEICDAKTIIALQHLALEQRA